MKELKSRPGNGRGQFFWVVAVMTLMAISEFVLIFDILSEYFGIYFDFYNEYHIELETLAVFTLGVSLIIFGICFNNIRRENRDYRSSVELASGEFLRVVDEKFREWNFTSSEEEVALLLIKGLTIYEVAQVRNTQTGTIKSQSNAVYRKSGLKGRNELVAYFIEDLLGGESLT